MAAMISPGVFTKELDQSFLTQGVSTIGGAIVGPFATGPAFSPTIVTSQADLETIFGIPDGTFKFVMESKPTQNRTDL